MLTYELQLDSSPLYDLTLSFGMFKKPLGLKFLKILQIGADWNKEVSELVGESFTKRVVNSDDLPFLDVIDLLIMESREKDCVEDFLIWLEKLGAGELYEILAPHMFQQTSLSFNLDEERKKCLELLVEWNEKYFSTLEGLNDKFRKDLSEKKESFDHINKEEFILRTSGGLVVEPFKGLERVVMTPTIHYRPLSASCSYQKAVIVRYPLIEDEQADVERNRILNIGRAISDENRLEMLKLLSTGRYNLTEIAKGIGTTKANAHHHLLFLRIAGLLHIHEIGDKNYLYYSLKKDFPELLRNDLMQVLSLR